MFADKETAARRADANAAAWKEAKKSAKVTGGCLALPVVAFLLLAVWLSGYVTGLPGADRNEIVEHETP